MTWFDFNHDILYLNLDRLRQYNTATGIEIFAIEELYQDLPKVKHLALAHPKPHTWGFGNFEAWLNDLLSHFDNLKTLYFVAERHERFDTTDWVLAEHNAHHEYATAWYERSCAEIGRGEFLLRSEQDFDIEWNSYPELLDQLLPDIEELERQKREHEQAAERRYTLPSMEVRIMIPRAKEERYKCARKAYEGLRNTLNTHPRYSITFDVLPVTDLARERSFLAPIDCICTWDARPGAIQDALAKAWGLEGLITEIKICYGYAPRKAKYLDPELDLRQVARKLPHSKFNSLGECISSHDHELIVLVWM